MLATQLQDEKAVVRQAQTGDPDAFRVLFDRYYRRIHGVARHIVNDEDLARDIVQQTFIRVFRYISTFDVSRQFYTWLYQIVVNLSIDAMRRRAARQTSPLDETNDGLPSRLQGPQGLASRVELKERVRQYLDQLPEHYKAVLVLREIEGFTCEEIADILQVKNVTVRWRLHHARKLFKALWIGAGENLECVED
jgi:RNA polymerase sigma-70 factor (ECF subfamily)